jgi:glyoxylase-like metal-dependent hydrolase (beta-lactamase superfamily II)
MTRSLYGSLGLVAALASSLACGPRDAKSVLEGAASALGASDLTSIQYTGQGSNFALGQNPRPDAPWPKFNVVRYERAIDYGSNSSREVLVRTQGEDPPRGGGGQPLAGEQTQTFLVSGGTAWNLAGENAVPAPAAAAERAIQIVLTLHGFVKAALASTPTLAEETIDGRTVYGLSFRHGDQDVRGTINAENLVEKIETTIQNTVLGAMPVSTSFSEYKDFGGVLFPTRIVQSQGGYPTLDIAVSEVTPNAPVEIAIPEAVASAAPAAVTVASEKLADGVWFLAGGSHNSVLVEFQDHVAVIEAPLNPERSEAVMAEVERLVPGKPLRYLVNTHHHFDHSGGVQTYAAKGVTVVTHEINVPFYQGLYAGGTFEGVGDHRSLTDGGRSLEIHHVQGNTHNEGLLMVYLPKEKILVQADAFSPRPGPPPSPANPFTVNLHENVVRLNLDVERIAPIHGAVVPLADLKAAIGEATD